MKRSDSERVRLKHALTRMRATIDNIEIGAKFNSFIGQEAAQACVQSAFEVSTLISKIDAFELAEQDAGGPPPRTRK